MNLSIIPSDGAVYCNGISYSGLQFSVPTEVHALQWKITRGWIEFVDTEDGIKPQNETITKLPLWALDAVEKWDEAEDANKSQPSSSGVQTL
jgi:hypothetical protein